MEDKAYNDLRLALNRIYTKTGGSGEIGLVGGQRIGKDALRIDCYGTVDEMNAFIGMACFSSDEASLKLAEILKRVPHELFKLGSILATRPQDVHPKQPA